MEVVGSEDNRRDYILLLQATDGLVYSFKPKHARFYRGRLNSSGVLTYPRLGAYGRQHSSWNKAY